MPSLWKYVRNEWFYTKSAAFLFTTSAILVVIFVLSAGFLPDSFGNGANYSIAQQAGFALLGILFGTSNIILLIGMFRFWVACDQSRPIARKIWFAVMIVGLLRLGLGAAAYCFVAYIPQVARGFSKGSSTVGT